jgi:serine protease
VNTKIYTLISSVFQLFFLGILIFPLISCAPPGLDQLFPVEGSISGTIEATSVSAVDGDVADPNAPYNPNNDFASAQQLQNPVSVGGYAEVVSDDNDFYQVNLGAGQVITLYVADAKSGADLDLGLYDVNDTSTPVAVSAGTGEFEYISVPNTGTYYVLVQAAANGRGSNYILSIGSQTLAKDIPKEKVIHLHDDFVPGDIIVQYKPTESGNQLKSQTMQSYASSLGLQLESGASGSFFSVLRMNGDSLSPATINALGMDENGFSMVSSTDQTLSKKYNTIKLLKELRSRPEIKTADLNYRVKPLMEPNDTYYYKQWHYPLINLPQAWEITQGSPNVVVAVVDTGVLLDHPDLTANLVPGYDFISNPAVSRDGDGRDPDPDDPGNSYTPGSSFFHGTHVAGTIAAVSNNGKGVAGIVRCRP